MRYSRKAISVLVLSLLLISSVATPAAAAWGGDTNVTNASEHSTDSELDSGQSENLSVSDGTLEHDRWADYNENWDIGTGSVWDLSIHNETIYSAEDSSPGLRSTDATTASENWFTDLPDDQNAVEGSDSYIFAGGNDGVVRALDPETGTVEWTYSQGDIINGLVASDGTLYSAGGDGSIHAIDIDNQTEEWNVTPFSTTTALDLTGSTLVAGSGNGDVHAIDAETGNSIWTKSPHSDTVYDIDATQDAVYTASRDQSVIALSTSDGSQDWSQSYSSIVWSVAEDDGTVFAGTNSDEINALTSSGSQKWSQSVSGRPNAIATDGTQLAVGKYLTNSLATASALERSQYVSDTHEVDSAVNGYVDLGLDNMVATVEWQGYGSDGWSTVATDTTTTSGLLTTDISDTQYSEWRTVVTLETDDSSTVWGGSISKDGVDFQNTAPILENPSPEDNGYHDDSDSVDLEVDVSDPEFGSQQGEQVTVTFYDGDDDSVIGSETLSSNGTASTTWSSTTMGENRWYAVAEDDWNGTTQTDTLSFKTPDKLYIYNESSPNELVNDSVEATVTFFADDESYTRTTTDGVIDLDGLPSGEFTVQVEADGYVTRQTVIRSITEQQEVFLLPESAETVNTRFELNDPTGQFAPSESRILIKKPIERDGTTTYKTVVGDTFGTGEYSTTLESEQRYLIEVENMRTGEIRELGPYVATVSETVVLEVDQLDFEYKEDGAGYRWNATYVNASGSPAIDFAFDTDHGYDELNVKIIERGSGQEIYSETWTDGSTIQDRIVIPDSVEDANETTYSVEWSATIGDGAGNTASVSGSVIVGPNADVPIEGVGDRVLQLVAIFLVLVIAGLFSAANVGVGGVVTSLSAGLLWMIGVLPGAVSGFMVGLALLISVLWMVRNARGPQ